MMNPRVPLDLELITMLRAAQRRGFSLRTRLHKFDRHRCGAVTAAQLQEVIRSLALAMGLRTEEAVRKKAKAEEEKKQPPRKSAVPQQRRRPKSAGPERRSANAATNAARSSAPLALTEGGEAGNPGEAGDPDIVFIGEGGETKASPSPKKPSPRGRTGKGTTASPPSRWGRAGRAGGREAAKDAKRPTSSPPGQARRRRGKSSSPSSPGGKKKSQNSASDKTKDADAAAATDDPICVQRVISSEQMEQLCEALRVVKPPKASLARGPSVSRARSSCLCCQANKKGDVSEIWVTYLPLTDILAADRRRRREEALKKRAEAEERRLRGEADGDGGDGEESKRGGGGGGANP
jgi:hypothetical protein